ncbi:MAG: AAA family ATPase [Streptosporangiaceae bacterium]
MDRSSKPTELHDRVEEWAALTEFASDPDPGTVLGIVYGRRRQGKTLLLELLAEATGGLTFTGLQQANSQNLADLAAAYAGFAAVPSASFGNWADAVEALLTVGGRLGRPVPVVLDEFPYLVEQAPELPSVLQRALSPRGLARLSGQVRLILCGSAFTVMRGLLGGSAPLRGRARMELLVQPFDFRDAADFWGVDDQPELAFRLHALVGGTPAYQAMCIDRPDSAAAFDDWVVRRLLSPASAMFREGSALLYEEPELGDAALYHAVLGAICGGARKRSEIAKVLGRPDSALSHPLDMLERVQLVAKVDDALRSRRPRYQVSEPLIRLQHLIIRPFEARLVGRARARVWEQAADTVESLIHGPHLEDLARSWCAEFAATETLGGMPSRCEPALIACRAHKTNHELDMVVSADPAHEKSRILAIGEVKAATWRIGLNQLERLRHIRSLLAADAQVDQPKLLLFSRQGFTSDLTAEAGVSREVELIDLPRLYHGS